MKFFVPVVGILLSVNVFLVGVSIFNRPSKVLRSSDYEKIEAYSCGYMAGQRAIWKAAKLPLPISPEWLDHCTPFKVTAFAHGFNLD